MKEDEIRNSLVIIPAIVFSDSIGLAADSIVTDDELFFMIFYDSHTNYMGVAVGPTKKFE